MISTVQDFFRYGMKREIKPLLPIPEGWGAIIDLGAGNVPMPGAVALDWPIWDATKDRIPYGDGQVKAIYAYHFLEHFTGDDIVKILRECQRVLMRGGVMYIVVPHRLGSMAFHDLDHKFFFTEDTLPQLFGQTMYDKNHLGWELDIGFHMVAGIVERNLCIMTQLRRR